MLSPIKLYLYFSELRDREFHITGYNTVLTQPKFWSNVSPPSSESKNKTRKKPVLRHSFKWFVR